MSTHNELAAAAHEVAKYWRDWPQSRRDSVRALSSFLADAIEALAVVVKDAPRRAECATCGRIMQVTKDGMLRNHNGDVWDGGWRQRCDGTGKPPAVTP